VTPQNFTSILKETVHVAATNRMKKDCNKEVFLLPGTPCEHNKPQIPHA
jgi:hypothetical protein